MTKKKKSKFWLYIAFAAIAGGLYTLLYFNGLNLIEEYPKEIGGAALLGVAALAKKWFGWNLAFLLKEETQEKAGAAIIKAQKSGINCTKFSGVKTWGAVRREFAIIDFMKKNPGVNRTKARLIIKMLYEKTKKENPKLFAKEKR